jgi:hypothetical protein
MSQENFIYFLLSVSVELCSVLFKQNISVDADVVILRASAAGIIATVGLQTTFPSSDILKVRNLIYEEENHFNLEYDVKPLSSEPLLHGKAVMNQIFACLQDFCYKRK